MHLSLKRWRQFALGHGHAWFAVRSRPWLSASHFDREYLESRSKVLPETPHLPGPFQLVAGFAAVRVEFSGRYRSSPRASIPRFGLSPTLMLTYQIAPGLLPDSGAVTGPFPDDQGCGGGGSNSGARGTTANASTWTPVVESTSSSSERPSTQGYSGGTN